MEAAPGILHRDYEKRRRRDVARPAPSLRTEWAGWPHSAFLHSTSHDRKWDSWRPPSTVSRNGPSLSRHGKNRRELCWHPAPNTPPTSHRATRLLWLSKEILRSLRTCALPARTATAQDCF